MTSSTPRRHRRLALMAAGMAAAMVLLPGAASAQVVHTMQQSTGAPGDPAVPGVPGDAPKPGDAPHVPTAPAPNDPSKTVTDLVGGVVGGSGGDPTLTGDHGGHERRDDTPDSDHLDDPKPPDHASGAVADIDVLKSHILDITKYDATIEDDGTAHADSTVLGLGGSRIIGSSASSDDKDRKDSNSGDLLSLCGATSGVLCLSLLYHDTVATEDRDSSLAAARGGVLALCLLGDNEEATATYECGGGISLGVAEGIGVAERDKKHGHTKADSANELLNLCIGKRDKLTEPCDGLGLQALHVDSASKSDKPDTERHSWLLGIDSNGKSSYLLDEPTALALPDGCGDSALLCLFLNQGKSVIFKNPKGAGSVQEALRLDVLNRTLLVVLGQAETLAHETEGRDHGKDHGRPPACDDKIDNDGDGHIDFPKDKDCDSPQDDSEEGHDGGNGSGKGDELAYTGADVASLLAGGFLLTGLGALTVAATRRRLGKHSL